MDQFLTLLKNHPFPTKKPQLYSQQQRMEAVALWQRMEQLGTPLSGADNKGTTNGSYKRSHPCARNISQAFLWHVFPATHLNIMLNSFRASSVTPVVFLKRKQQS